jgi:hypothetical protein
MPPVDQRQPYDPDNLPGYDESLLCWFDRNQEAVEWFLENADEIRQHIETCIKSCPFPSAT